MIQWPETTRRDYLQKMSHLYRSYDYPQYRLMLCRDEDEYLVGIPQVVKVTGSQNGYIYISTQYFLPIRYQFNF